MAARDKFSLKEREITNDFFGAFPNPDDYDDTDKMNATVNKLAHLARQMHALSIEAKSLTIMDKAKIMADEVSRIFNLLSARYQHQHKASGLVGAGGQALTVDSTKWLS